MRGLRRIGLLAVSLVCMFAFSVATAFGDADDEIRSAQAPGGATLRDVATPLANQPDALEFINTGPVELVTSGGTSICHEVEFGTTVVKAKAVVTLAIPFGVAENDECTVPTWFDTTAEGAVGNAAVNKVATVTIADNVNKIFVPEFHNLKFSQEVAAGVFCVGNLDKIVAASENVAAGFVEETTPNLNVKFAGTKIPITGTGCPFVEGKITATFFLETPSTKTDTAWFES